MPAKKKKKKGGAAKGKAKGKKAAKAAAEKEEVVRTCRNFLRIYQQRCAATNSTAAPRICRDCRECLENEKPLAKFVLEPSQSVIQARQQPETAKPVADPKKLATTQNGPTATHDPAIPAASIPPPPPILLHPLIESWLEVKYTHMRCLYIWHIELTDDSIVALAFFFESPLGLGQQLKVLEVRDARLSPWSIARLARSLRLSQLTVLNLDYNILPQPGLASLCEALQGVTTLQTLSLNYCNMNCSCGETLGTLVSMTQIRELSVAGNRLECEGMTELLRPVVALCEASDPSQQILPPLAKLFLQDNAIDIHGTCGGMFAPVISMRALKRWVLSSPVLEEINLDGNFIGDGGGREVMQAMKERKEVGLPPIKMTVTSRINPDIFSAITDLNPSHGKKKKKRTGKVAFGSLKQVRDLPECSNLYLLLARLQATNTRGKKKK